MLSQIKQWEEKRGERLDNFVRRRRRRRKKLRKSHGQLCGKQAYCLLA